MINTIIKGAITIALAIGSLFTPTADLNVGGDGFKFVAGSTYYLSGSGIDTDDTSITLTSFKMPVSDLELAMSDFGDIGYATIEPGKSKKEFISFTGITQDGSSNKATLTGVTRGLSFVSPYTASTTLAQNHSGGAKLIISNPPQLYNKATFKDNEETINKVWTFDADNMPVSDADVNATSSRQFATKFYVDNTANQGAATSTESVGGIVELATEVEVASTTASTSNKPLVIQAQNATSTPTYSCDSSGTSGALCIPVAENDGKLNQNWLDLTEEYSFSNTITTNATTTNATTTNLAVTNITVSGTFSGTHFASSTNYTASGTYTKSDNVQRILVQMWGAGGSGATGNAGSSEGGSGGGGGEYSEYWFNASDLESSITITIGTGGAAVSSSDTSGNDGGNTDFGGIATTTGGKGGINDNTDVTTGGGGGFPYSAGFTGLWGIGVDGADGGDGLYSAAGGGTNVNDGKTGGDSKYGGAGGGGASNSAGSGGSSDMGGDGGNGGTTGNGQDGEQPGGGGGASDQATSGAGGDGQIIVTEFF